MCLWSVGMAGNQWCYCKCWEENECYNKRSEILNGVFVIMKVFCMMKWQKAFRFLMVHKAHPYRNKKLRWKTDPATFMTENFPSPALSWTKKKLCFPGVFVLSVAFYSILQDFTFVSECNIHSPSATCPPFAPPLLPRRVTLRRMRGIDNIWHVVRIYCSSI